jgi:hypothetical protein
MQVFGLIDCKGWFVFAQLGNGEKENKVYHPHFKGNFIYQDNLQYFLQAQECLRKNTSLRLQRTVTQLDDINISPRIAPGVKVT